MKKIKTVICAALIVAILAGAAFILASKGKENEPQLSGTVTNIGVRDLGELVTEEYCVTTVETSESVKTLWGHDIGLTRKKFVFSYDALVTAGVNFENAEIETDDLTKTITVHIPEAEIFTATVDNDSFMVYVEDSGLFNPITLEDVNAAQSDLITKSRKAAVDKGILIKAQENAERLLLNMVKSMDTGDYTVVVK